MAELSIKKKELIEYLKRPETSPYELTLYYDEALKGVADEQFASDFDEAVDIAHEMISQGGYLKVEQEFSGKSMIISTEDYFKDFEGESPLRDFEFNTHDTEVMEIQNNLYNQYVSEWINENITQKDINTRIEEFEGSRDWDGEVSKEAFAEYIEECGFGEGSLYVCFEEFLDHEYQDEAWRTAHISEYDEMILQKYDESLKPEPSGKFEKNDNKTAKSIEIDKDYAINDLNDKLIQEYNEFRKEVVNDVSASCTSIEDAVAVTLDKWANTDKNKRIILEAVDFAINSSAPENYFPDTVTESLDVLMDTDKLLSKIEDAVLEKEFFSYDEIGNALETVLNHEMNEALKLKKVVTEFLDADYDTNTEKAEALGLDYVTIELEGTNDAFRERLEQEGIGNAEQWQDNTVHKVAVEDLEIVETALADNNLDYNIPCLESPAEDSVENKKQDNFLERN